MPMERRPFGRDWGLSLRMTLCLVLLAGLYLPFLLWILGFAYFFGGMPGVVVGGLGALGLLALAPYLSELLALNTARVRWDHPSVDARLRPMVERLCALADLPVPRLAVMPTDIPNAFSAGRSPTRGVVVVTEGLLGDLDDAELEAVVAHELAHIANRDAFVMTIAAAPSMVGRKLLWGFALLPFTAAGPKKILAAIAVLYLLPLLFLGWIVYALATLLVMSITRYREFVADRGSAILTGAPEQLGSALQKIAGAMPLIPQRDLREVTGMNALFVLPARTEGDGFEVDPLRIFPTHPPLDHRLERLAAFARDLGRSRGVEPAEAPARSACRPAHSAAIPRRSPRSSSRWRSMAQLSRCSSPSRTPWRRWSGSPSFAPSRLPRASSSAFRASGVRPRERTEWAMPWRGWRFSSALGCSPSSPWSSSWCSPSSAPARSANRSRLALFDRVDLGALQLARVVDVHRLPLRVEVERGLARLAVPVAGLLRPAER